MSIREARGGWGIYMYLGGFPAQTRHVRTVRPLVQDSWFGSRASNEAGEVPGAMLIVVDIGVVWRSAEWLDRSLLLVRLQPGMGSNGR